MRITVIGDGGWGTANILACVVAKRFGVERTIAEVENLEYIRLAEEMGVDAVINKKLITAGKIFKMTLSNKVRFVKYMSGTNAEILEFFVLRLDWGIGIHVPYKNGFYNMSGFGNSQSLHFAIGYPF